VSSHPRITSLGEIFHNDYLDHPNYYYNYYQKAIAARPELAMPAQQHRIDLLDGYIQHVVKRLKEQDDYKDWVFLGINYNSLHSMNTYWQNVYDVPYLVNIIRWKAYHVVHIIRRNLLAAAISEMRAKLTGVWHIREGEERPAAADAKVTVDPAALLRELRARRLEIDLIEAGLQAHNRCLTLYYEEFFDNDGRPRLEQLDRLSRFLQLERPLTPISTYHQTRSDTLRATIENYDEVAAALAGTQFARFLDPGGTGAPGRTAADADRG